MQRYQTVCVVIPNYNGSHYLEACLKALEIEKKRLVQTHQIEIVIVDNASTDDDYQWVLESYPDTIWIGLQENFGFSRAVNEGIKHSQSDYVILLNNDTVIETDFIAQLVETISGDDRIFAACSQMIQYNHPHLIDDAGDEYTLLGWARKRGDGQPVATYPKQEEVFSACAGAAIYRQAVFETIGYFDEKFFAYMEDVDISYRARIYGYKNVYCPKAKVLHIGSGTSGSRHNAFKVKLAARNNVYVAYKNMPFIQLIFNTPFLMIGYLIKYLFFCKKGLGKAYKEGIQEAVRSLSHIEKVPFRMQHIYNYMKIEVALIINTFKLIRDR